MPHNVGLWKRFIKFFEIPPEAHQHKFEYSKLIKITRDPDNCFKAVFTRLEICKCGVGRVTERVMYRGR